MLINEILNLLNLSEKEAANFKRNFYVDVAFLDVNDLKKKIDFLNMHNTHISKAKDVKVLINPLAEIEKKFDILSEINETEIFQTNPELLSSNVLDIFRRIKYCKQSGITYKTEDGKYCEFLLSEKEWQKQINQNNFKVKDEKIESSEKKEDDLEIATLEPKIVTEPQFTPVDEELTSPFEFVSFEELKTVKPESNLPTMEEVKSEVISPVKEEVKDNHQDIKDYIKEQEQMDSDLKNVNNQVKDFAQIRKELEESRKKLEEEINIFDFLDEEEKGMGRAA